MTTQNSNGTNDMDIQDMDVQSSTNHNASSENGMQSAFTKMNNPILPKFLDALPPQVAEFNRKYMLGEHVENDKMEQVPDTPPHPSQQQQEGGEQFRNIHTYICANCNASVAEPIRCEGCGMMAYCNKECATKHWESRHGRDCKCMSLVRDLESDLIHVDLTPHPIIGKKMIAKRDIKKGEQIISEKPLVMVVNYDKDDVDKLGDTAKPILFGSGGSNDERYYFFNDKRLFHFESDMSTARLIKLKAKVVDAIIQQYPFFIGNTFFNTCVSGTDAENNAIQLLHSHHLLLSVSDKGKLMELKDLSYLWGMVGQNHLVCQPLFSLVQVGMGFYPKLSLVNHSCNANMDFFYSNGAMTCIATRNIRKGDEVTIDYSLNSSYVHRAQRALTLQTMCKFKCICAECMKSSDFVKSDWTIRCKSLNGIRDELDKLQILINTEKRVELINSICNLWKNHKDKITEAICVVVDLASMLVSAQAGGMSSNLPDTEKNRLSPSEITSITTEIIGFAIGITNKEEFNNNNMEKPRNLFHIRAKLYLGHLFINIKDLLIQYISAKNDKEGEKIVKKYLTGEKRIKTGRGDRVFTHAALLCALIKDDIAYLSTDKPPMEMLELDRVVNTLFAKFPQFLSLIDTYVCKPHLSIKK